jgi:hypothetical protein
MMRRTFQGFSMPLVTVKFGKDTDNQQVIALLTQIGKDLKKLMTDLETANLAITRIKTATDEQGVVLQQEATTLQTISDEFDTLISKLTPGTTITPELLASLQAQADQAEAVSTSIKAQAAFSTAIASKGATNPVPVPVPPPTS